MDANIVTYTRYVTRYVKEHYVQKKIRRDLYNAFVKWCGEDSINMCLEKALRVLVANTGTVSVSNTVTNIGANSAGATPSPSSAKTFASNTVSNTGANAVTNIGANRGVAKKHYKKHYSKSYEDESWVLQYAPESNEEL